MPAFKKVNKGGRPPKLTQELIDKICNILRTGVYVETAVVVCGISKGVYYQWIKVGQKEPHSLHKKFLDAVEMAQEEATVRDVMNIDKCAMGTKTIYERYPEGSTEWHEQSQSWVSNAGKIVYDPKGRPVIAQHGSSPDWNASAWRLARRRPKEWMTVERKEITGANGAPLETKELTSEEYKKSLEEAKEKSLSIAKRLMILAEAAEKKKKAS